MLSNNLSQDEREGLVNWMKGSASSVSNGGVSGVLGMVKSIDGTSTGNTALFTVPGGMRAVTTDIVVVGRTITSSSAAPYISVGSNSTSYNDIMKNKQLVIDATDEIENPTSGVSTFVNRDSASAQEVIYVKVNTGATATAYTIDVILLGFLVTA